MIPKDQGGGGTPPRSQNSQHARPTDFTLFQFLECLIRVDEIENLDLSLQRNFARELQEFATILSCSIGDAANDLLVIEQFIIQRGNLRHRDSSERKRPAFAQHAQRLTHQHSRRREHDRRMQLLRRSIFSATGPDSAEFACMRLMVFTTSEDEHIALLMSCQLDDEMRRSSESVETQVFSRTNSSEPVRPISNNARAQQRRSMVVVEDIRNGIAELGRHDAVFGVSTVDVISSKTAIDAEVLKPATTVFAAAISRVQPSNPDAISFFMVSDARTKRVDDAHDLMSRNHRTLVRREVAFNSMQIGLAKSAEVNLNWDFTRRGRRSRYMPHGERRRFSRPRLVNYHG